LDKELAEEKAENLEQEVEKIKQQMEISNISGGKKETNTSITNESQEEELIQVKRTLQINKQQQQTNIQINQQINK
jgi:hypothetical protein